MYSSGPPVIAVFSFLGTLLSEAPREWTPLAKQGHADAQNKLGKMYQVGIGVPKNHKTAVKWYKLAVKQDHTKAQLAIGDMYGLGEGVPQDEKQAFKWYLLAAENGNPEGQIWMGSYYSAGVFLAFFSFNLKGWPC